MGIVESSRANMLRTLAHQSVPRKSDSAVVEVAGADSSKSKHQNPAWVRRCVASYISKSNGSGREAVSKAFAICRAQYNELEDPEAKNASAFKGKKGKERLGQYEKILAKARKKPT